MFTARNYVLAKSLDEAWKLNQSKSNQIVGGMLWLKMSRKKINTVIDLSELGFDTIEESENEFKIGAMCSLRTLEMHKGLEAYFGGMIRNSVESIVGTQFRNLATVGGSIYSRFGFSDILTAFMALDSYVELHKGGIIALDEYAKMPCDRDILKYIIVKKDSRQASYKSFRNTATDFPVLACAVSRMGNESERPWKIVYGARPGKAIEYNNNLSFNPSETELLDFAEGIKKSELFAGNMRGSKEYRQLLAAALLKKAMTDIMGKAEK